MSERDGTESFADGFEVGIEPLVDGRGLVVSDPIERHRVTVYTTDPTPPDGVDTGRLRFPTDAAARVRTDSVSLPTVVATYVRDADGGMLAEVDHFDDRSFDDGSYVIELCAPIKLYVEVAGPLSIATDGFSTRVAFDDVRDVTVGARSRHERPATTVTTTGDPRDVMAAVSTFGSALKTTSPERSYPTLRGHPPLVERGAELSIPSGLAAPDTGVRVEVPPELESVYVAAPLAYYLGAQVVPGETPRLVTDDGHHHPLDGPRGYESEVARVLKQTFLLDCVTRTEGLYRVTLRSRSVLDSRLDVDVGRLYDLPLAERLREYLAIPYDDVRDLVPEWKLTTHVAPTPDRVELLPFVTNDLAVVRTPSGSRVAGSEIQTAATDAFAREATVRGAAGTAPWADRSFFRPDDDDSLERAWAGEGAPVGASKAIPEAYHNRLERSPIDGDIGITVVCNDPLMAVERDMVETAYGAREDLPFEIDVHYDLSCAALRDVLATPTEFLHYIGHIDDDGFQCADGKLDARTLDEVGPAAFLLNACRSYDQGEALVRSGAIAAIVTLSDVINSSAVTMGRTLARLLNRGFPLRSALEVTREEYAVGEQYVVVGDGNYALAQAESGTLSLCEIERADDTFSMEYWTYNTSSHGMGTMVKPYVPSNDEYYLSSGMLDEYDLVREELLDFLQLETVPVRYDGKFGWSTELNLTEL
jgi:hypothetical protein